MPGAPSILQDDAAVGDRQQFRQRLVDNQDGEPLGLQLPDRRPDVLSDDRRKAFRCFVEDQQARIGHQRTADCQHLLLSAGERPCHLRVTLGKAGEEIIDALQAPGAGPCGRNQVFMHREVWKAPPPLRHQPDAELGDAMRWLALEIGTRKPDGSGTWRVEVADGPDGRRLAHSIATHESDGLAFLDRKIHSEQRLARPIRGFYLGNVEQHQAWSPRYAVRTAGSRRISSTVPVAMTRP